MSEDNQHTGPDDRPVQDDRPGSDQGAVFDRAAFEMREVADRAVGADVGLELARAMEHRAVLHRRARADHDATLITAQHRLGPNR